MFRRSDGLFLLVAVLVVGFYVAVSGGGFPLDDSWIHQTYAYNLGMWGEWAFVRGEPSAASTAPLYTLLLALGYALRIPYMLWTHGVGALALGLTGMIGARMAEQIAPESRRVGLFTGLTLVLTWHLIWAAASGMETMLFSMFTLLLLWLGWREVRTGFEPQRREGAEETPYKGVYAAIARGAVFGVCGGLAMMTRPEGGVLCGLVGLALLIVRPQGRAFWGWAVGAVVGFGLTIAPYLLYNLSLTGGLLPDTAAAKQAEYGFLLALPLVTRMLDLLYPLISGLQILFVPAAIYYNIKIIKRYHNVWPVYLLPLIWSLVLVVLYAARLPVNYQHGRYVIPALPAFIVCGVVGMAWLLQLRRNATVRILTRSLALSVVGVCLVYAFVLGVGAYRQDVRIIEEEMVTAARWIAQELPPGELLAVHDIGAVGYFAPRPILDLAGLVSPEVVPIIRNADALWALMEARNVKFIMGMPNHIPGQTVYDPRLCPLFSTDGATARAVGEPNMAVYALSWEKLC